MTLMWTRDRTVRRRLVLLGAVLLAGCVSTSPTPQQPSVGSTASPAGSPAAAGSPTPAASPTIAPTAAPSEPTGWQLLPVSPAIGAADLASVATFRGGLVAVGNTTTGDPRGAIACSTDGRTWQPCAGAPSMEGLTLAGMGVGDSGLVVVGASDRGAVSLATPDGVSWSRNLLPNTKGLTAQSVAWHGGRFVAIGVDYQTEASPSIAWMSLDGRTWTRLPDIEGPAQATLTGIVALPNGFMVAGSFRGHVATWVSTDGASWTRSELPGPPTGDPGRLRLVEGQFFLPVGQDLWSSREGRHWLRTAIPGFGNGVFAVGAIPGGFIAVGRSSEGEQPGVVAIADAGLTFWTLQPADPAFDGALALDVILSPDGRYVVGVGNSIGGSSVLIHADPAGLALP